MLVMMILGTFLYFFTLTSNQMLLIIHFGTAKAEAVTLQDAEPWEVGGRLLLRAFKSSWTLGNTWSLTVLAQAALTKYCRLGVLAEVYFLLFCRQEIEEPV